MAIDATAAAAGGGEKRHRVDEQAVAADAIPADRISALPDDLRQRILTHLALKDAIRTGAVARGWRDLWRTRWEHRASVEVHLRSRDDPRRELDALEREPRRRLDRFSLIVESSKLKPPELRRLTEYTAECGVEDLHVELRKTTVAHKLTFRLPLCSPLLARLSLRRINISSRCYNGAQPFRALEVIRLHSIYVHYAAFKKMLELCPSLLTLYLRDCNCGSGFYLLMPPNLRSVTIANCVGMAGIILQRQHEHGLRSFRYIGDFVRAPFSLSRDAVLADLYIRFAHSVSEQDIITEKLKSSMSSMTLPQDLSGLNVLTICCNALPVASSLTDDGANAQLLTLNLHNLRELQLLMSEMEAANLADIYGFLKICQCPKLERLFVQLPALSYKPMEGSIDEVREEPPEDGLDNLLTVKVMNFNWRDAEVQLVSFLLRKASSLHKLLIVSSNVAPLDLPGVQADLLLLKKALASGKIILSESDDAATQPYHSDL